MYSRFFFLAVLVNVCKHGLLLAVILHHTILKWTIANGSYLVLFIKGGHHSRKTRPVAMFFIFLKASAAGIIFCLLKIYRLSLHFR